MALCTSASPDGSLVGQVDMDLFVQMFIFPCIHRDVHTYTVCFSNTLVYDLVYDQIPEKCIPSVSAVPCF